MSILRSIWRGIKTMRPGWGYWWIWIPVPLAFIHWTAPKESDGAWFDFEKMGLTWMGFWVGLKDTN